MSHQSCPASTESEYGGTLVGLAGVCAAQATGDASIGIMQAKSSYTVLVRRESSTYLNRLRWVATMGLVLAFVMGVLVEFLRLITCQPRLPAATLTRNVS